MRGHITIINNAEEKEVGMELEKEGFVDTPRWLAFTQFHDMAF